MVIEKLVGPLNCAPEKRVFLANFVLKKLALLENFTSKKLVCPLNFEPEKSASLVKIVIKKLASLPNFALEKAAFSHKERPG